MNALSYFSHPRRIYVKQEPFFNEISKNGPESFLRLRKRLYELDVTNVLVLVIPYKQWGWLSSSPYNKRTRYVSVNLNAPRNPLREILKDYSKKTNKHILVVQVPSPHNGFDVWYIYNGHCESLNYSKNYKMVGSVISTSPAKKVLEKLEKKAENYEKILGIPKEEFEQKYGREFNEREERMWLRENKQMVFSYLSWFFETLSKLFKQVDIYTMDSKSGYLSKNYLVELQKNFRNKPNLKFYIGKNWNEMQRMPPQKLIAFLNYVHGKSIYNIDKISKYFAKGIEYVYPPNFVEEGNYYSMLHEEDGTPIIDFNKFGGLLYPEIQDDKFMWRYYYDKYFPENSNEEFIKIRTAYMPIEALILEEWERSGELIPFPVKKFNLDFQWKDPIHEILAIHPSTLVAPCPLQRLYSQLRIEDREFFTEDEWLTIQKGSMLHKLVLENETNRLLAHELLTILFDGKTIIPRNSYTEVPIKGYFDDIPITGRIDSLAREKNKVVIMDLKSTIALPEAYKKVHLMQEYVYGSIVTQNLRRKKSFENLQMSDMHIILYQAITSNPEIPVVTRKRYGIVTEEVKESTREMIREVYNNFKRALKHPIEIINALWREEERRGCNYCLNNPKAEIKKQIAINELKRTYNYIKQNFPA